MSLQDIIEKVQKLRNLSKSSNINEATTAAALADKLISEYRLSEAELNTDTNSSNDILIEADNYLYESGRITTWKSNLATRLAKHYGCALYNDWTTHNYRMYSRYKLVGKKSDIEIVNYMFSWLQSEITRLILKEGKGKGKVFCNSYCLGAVAGISHQLEQNKKDQTKTAEQTNQMTALVALNNRHKQAEDFMNSLHNLKTTKNRTYNQINSGAFKQGEKQGKSIHLGKSLEGSCKMLGK